MSEDLIGKLPKPVIVMDVDGVLLNWGSRFKEYCDIVGVDVSHIAERLQTTELFSLSKELGLKQEETLKLINGYAEHKLGSQMTAPCEAVRFVNRHKADFDFIAVSGFHNSEKALSNRKKNLLEVFGDVFVEVHCVGIDCIPRGETPISNKGYVFTHLHEQNRIAAYIDDDARNIMDAYYNLGLDRDEIYHLCTHKRVVDIDNILAISYTVTPSLDLVDIKLEVQYEW